MVKPFKEIPTQFENQVIRIFDSKFPTNLFQWHKDDENRRIKVLSKSLGWQFQFDNEIPFDLSCSTTIYVPKGKWHRLIKGCDTITLIVYKL